MFLVTGNNLVSLTLAFISMVFTVCGHTVIQSVKWNNQTVCVENYTNLNDNKTIIQTLCENIIKNTSKDKTSPEEKEKQIEGTLYPFVGENRRLQLEITSECLNNVSTCPVKEVNTTCYQTNLFCMLSIKNVVETNKDIGARSPCSFTQLCKKLNLCYGSPFVTYHHSRYALEELGECISQSPDIFFWTGSYIKQLRNDTDQISQLKVMLLNAELKVTNRTKCIRLCLNNKIKENPKVSLIAYNSTTGECHCFAKIYENVSYSRMEVDLYDKVYEIKDFDGNKITHLANKKKCIAVKYRGSSTERKNYFKNIKYLTQNCSHNHSILCGSNKCVSHGTNQWCDYSGESPQSRPLPTTTSPKTETSTHTEPTTKQGYHAVDSSSKALIISIVSVCIVIMIGIIVAVNRCRVCRKKQPMERGRPNSMSNRTYMMQNPVEDGEDLYSSITEHFEFSPDIRKPLLPPRNNVKRDGETEVTFKTDYSTPSDTVKADADVYTDTYDSPLRFNSTDKTKTPADPKSVNNVSTDGYECHATCSANLDEKSVHFQKDRPPSKSEHEIADNSDIVSQSQDTFTHIDETLQDNQCSNNYFTLAKPGEPLSVEAGSIKDITETCDNQINEAETSDYEDTSVLDNRIDLRVSDKAATSYEAEGSGEKSLLCTISPYLLKQLNIKIVPDNNDYSFYKKWPKSSSDEHLSIPDLADGELAPSLHNIPPQNPYANKIGDNGDMTDDYDKLCYVRRVVSAGKTQPRNVYYHFVKQNDQEEKTISRRASV